jgi:hypothetical protein
MQAVDLLHNFRMTRHLQEAVLTRLRNELDPPLALGLSADVFVVSTKILTATAAAAAVAVAVLACLIGFWHVLPLLARARRTAGGPMARRKAMSQ